MLRGGLRNLRNIGKARAGLSQVCYCRLLCPLFQMIPALIVRVRLRSRSQQPRALTRLTSKPAASLYARGLAGDQQAVIDCIAALEQSLAAKPRQSARPGLSWQRLHLAESRSRFR